MVAIPANPAIDSRRADELSERGVERLAQGDPVAAIDAFSKALACDPNHTEAHHGLIRALCDADKFESAAAAAQNLAALTPDDPLAYTSLSIALQKAGQIPEAEAAAARARILEWKRQLAAPDEPPAVEGFLA